jgi:hypothetical protein
MILRMDMKDILKLCKLNEEEMQKYLDLGKDVDHKTDHSRAYRTMMNQTRRELLKFIGTDIRTNHQIEKEFQTDFEQLRYHLSMLEQLLYIMYTATGWKATPRGIGFLFNAIMGE